jgi:hypothetical protein
VSITDGIFAVTGVGVNAGVDADSWAACGSDVAGAETTLVAVLA